MIIATMSDRSRSLTKRTTATTMRPRTTTVEVSIGGIIPRSEESGPSGLEKRFWDRVSLIVMSCRKGKSEVKAKSGRFRCTDCGAVVKKKADVCEPKKVKKK